MRTSRTRRTARRWAVAMVAVAASVGGVVAAGPAAAYGADGSDGTDGSSADTTTVLCTERVPSLQSRIDRALERIGGDEDTRGSVAFLQQRIARAEARDDQAVADLLQIRLENRQTLQGLLEQRRDDLAAWVETYCGTGE